MCRQLRAIGEDQLHKEWRHDRQYRIAERLADEQLQDTEWADYMLGKTLLGRLGKPEEVANVALFLASNESAWTAAWRAGELMLRQAQPGSRLP
ncbi:SDR family oxidoreductase [Xanthomonas hortorum]|uniref:SDR family oxidoreductase n=1 Tax=Xanthomonas hortorum TaxID=56454 RepID=UPI00178C4C84|nr:SDR family oxidoreductase [Xanthomonas hortorum]UTS74239.1 SDR family oxidoreductase [Xanthomonas hortorum]